MLRFEPVAFDDDEEMRYGAVIVTSANALRGIENQLRDRGLLKLPLFAVGEHTAAAARSAGSETVIPAKGDAAALRDLVLASVRDKNAEEDQPAALSGRAPISPAIWPANSASAGLPSSRRRHTGWFPYPACRARLSDAPLPPTGSRRCCIIHGVARARSSNQFALPGLKYRRWRSRNAVSRLPWPRWFATPGRHRSWWRHRRTKMPYSSCWTVLCTADRATTRFRAN